MSQNRVASNFRPLIRTAAPDVLANGATFANYAPDDAQRVVDCTQAFQIVLALESAGDCVIVPFWAVKTVDNELGWFRDKAQTINVLGPTREVRTIDVRAGRLLLWIESIATGAVALNVATLRTV